MQSQTTSHTLVNALRSHLQASTAQPVDLHETHISSVLLAGDQAYKLKKPVRLPFLDFSTIESRRHFCEEEVRLNGRLAPSLYLGVVPVCGTPEAPRCASRRCTARWCGPWWAACARQLAAPISWHARCGWRNLPAGPAC